MHAGVQLFQASATTLPVVIVLLKEKNAAFALYQKKESHLEFTL